MIEIVVNQLHELTIIFNVNWINRLFYWTNCCRHL